MHEPLRSIGFFQGEWVPQASIRISIDDLGFRSGVTAVERLRTYGHRVFELQEHLGRLERTVAELGIIGLPSRDRIAGLIGELLARNIAALTDGGDTGITVFATPGEVGGVSPTLGLHLNEIDHARVVRLRSSGQTLVVTEVTQPSTKCWPRTIKTRCRLHYHRADATARQTDPGAVGILVDEDGSITETSIANLACVEGGQLVSPPRSQVLGGITQVAVERLARKERIPWTHRRISPDQLRSADEVLLMGTDNGLWFASCIDSTPIAEGQPGPIFRRLLGRFDELTGSVSAESPGEG